ncbi:penicillin-binding protein activator [Biostraticola tofi]|uniref:Penicillin-binding protein activator LpoA n=1 Tax=Biostraticola tofi TaxID=466109 RepID=A0A4R3Z1C7_9GAMM|nr:penicillin-binding protein activator [Biostraticola tofi]TCV98795.1 hypothetical protein EDC52_102115 [Biostraticola tofi]
MLPSNVMGLKTRRVIPVVLAALILAACTGQAPRGSAGGVQEKAGASSSYYLQQMQQSSDDTKTGYQLLAIRALINEGKLDEANRQLSALPQGLNEALQRERVLLSAEFALAQGQQQNALAALKQLNAGSLTDAQKLRYYQAYISAGKSQPSLDLVRVLIAQEPLVGQDAHQQNIDQTWQALLGLTAQQQAGIAINADENVLQGWLDLLRIYNDNRQDPTLLKTAIADWQVRYPHNPAAKTLPTSLSQMQNYQPGSVGKIALLLPLSGQARVFSNAIQQGFNAARNGQQITAPAPQPVDTAAAGGQIPAAGDSAAAGGQVPAAGDSAAAGGQVPAVGDSAGDTQLPVGATETNDGATGAAGQPDVVPAPAANVEVQVYDTVGQSLPALLTRAQQDGATLVVGPLLKNEVEQLYNAPGTLNVLALNHPENLQNRPNMCYFALSPEDEARDAAAHIYHQGRQQPLLLIPRGPLGDRVAKAFSEAWAQAGGSTVLEQRIGSAAELKQGINSGAGIRLSGTPVTGTAAGAPQSVTIAGLTLDAPSSDGAVSPSAAPSGNVDAVYIIATPAELALIKPMIDMRTSSRSKPALFASSRSYQADAGPDYRLELDGLEFSDIPLLTGANPALLQQTRRQFNADYSLVRLYAMGMDAWTLANHFTQMRQIPGFQITGGTGLLTASGDCVINRKLSWLKYQRGQLVQAQ